MATIGASAQATLLTPTNKFVFSLEDATNIGTYIDTKLPTFPYGNPMQITFTYNVIIGRVYSIKLWESPDTTPTGLVRGGYSGSVLINGSFARKPIYAEVGVTPGWTAGALSVVDGTLAGWEFILRRNPEYLVPATETGNSTISYSFDTVDTISFINGNQLGANGEQWIIEFVPQNTPIVGQPSNVFSSGRIIKVDEVLTGADGNQALSVQATASKITTRQPSLASVPAYTFYYIYSSGGNHINQTIECSGSDKIMYNALLYSQIWLGQGECAKLFKAPFGPGGADVWCVDGELQGMRMVGSFIECYTVPPGYLNCLGDELQRALYPRLFAYAQVIGMVTETDWNFFTTYNGRTVYPNHSKFSSGDGSTTFRIPRLVGMVMKAQDSEQGEIEFDNVGLHAHWMFEDFNQGSNDQPGPTDPVAKQGDSGGDYHYSMKIGNGTPASRGVTSSATKSDGNGLLPSETTITTIKVFKCIKF